MIRRFIRLALVPAAAIAAIAVPSAAFACTGTCSANGGPVTATGNVPATVTLSGLTATTIDFGTLTPNMSLVKFGSAESYTVTSNNPTGYVLSITPSGSGLANGTVATIPNTDLAIGEQTEGQSFTLAATGPTTLDTQAGPATVTYTEDWYLSTPAVLPVGTYSEQFTYLAMGQ